MMADPTGMEHESTVPSIAVIELDADGRHYRIGAGDIYQNVPEYPDPGYEVSVQQLVSFLEGHAQEPLVIIASRKPETFAGSSLEEAMRRTGTRQAFILQYTFAWQGSEKLAGSLVGAALLGYSLRGEYVLWRDLMLEKIIGEGAVRGGRSILLSRRDFMRRLGISALSLVSAIAAIELTWDILASGEQNFNEAGARSAITDISGNPHLMSILLDNSVEGYLSTADVADALRHRVTGQQIGFGATAPSGAQVFLPEK